MDADLITRAVTTLAKGVSVTLTLAAISVSIGFCLGLGLAVMRLSGNRLLSGFAEGYSAVFRGTPLLVQLFLFYYGLGQFDAVRNNALAWWVIGDAMHCAILALALNTAAYTSEILRGGLMSIPVGLIEAARSGACELVDFTAEPKCWRTFTGRHGDKEPHRGVHDTASSENGDPVAWAAACIGR